MERTELGLLRRRNWFCRLAAVSFIVGVSAALLLAVIYCWPNVNVPVYYVVVRPAFVWYTGLLPLLGAGFFGVKLRWGFPGLLVWLIGFVTVEEVTQLLQITATGRHEEYLAAKMAYRSFSQRRRSGTNDIDIPLRLITWNIAGGNFGTHGAVRQLAALEPDIVFFQEFHGGELKTALNRHPALSSHCREGGRTTILSRYPVDRLPNGPLSEKLGGVWEVEIAPGKFLSCINLHLSPRDLRTQLFRGWSVKMLRNGINRTARELAQVEQTVAHYLERGPVVLAGDFNLPPHYPYLEQATGRMADCFEENGHGWGKTAPAKFPAVRVDIIYVPQRARVYYCRAVPTEFSDHYMTLAEVAIRPRNEQKTPGDNSVPHSGEVYRTTRRGIAGMPYYSYAAGSRLRRLIGQVSAGRAPGVGCGTKAAESLFPPGSQPRWGGHLYRR